MIHVNSTQICSVLYQSLLLQKVVSLLSFFAILVLQLLQPEDTNTGEQDGFDRRDERKYYFGFCSSVAKFNVAAMTLSATSSIPLLLSLSIIWW